MFNITYTRTMMCDDEDLTVEALETFISNVGHKAKVGITTIEDDAHKKIYVFEIISEDYISV